MRGWIILTQDLSHVGPGPGVGAEGRLQPRQLGLSWCADHAVTACHSVEAAVGRGGGC